MDDMFDEQSKAWILINAFQLAAKLTPTHRQSYRCGKIMATVKVSKDGKQSIFTTAEYLYAQQI